MREIKNATIDSFLRSFPCSVLLSQDRSYTDYLRQVEHRFIPGVY